MELRVINATQYGATFRAGRAHFVDILASKSIGGACTFYVRNESTGISVPGIFYGRGTPAPSVAYDFPERLPRAVKDAIAAFFAR